MRTVLITLAALFVAGCSTQGVMVCGVKPLGQDERGITYVLAQCEEHKPE